MKSIAPSGPIEVGKTYLDIWGRVHEIRGFVREYGTKDRYIPSQVWSMSSHFYMATGRRTCPGHDLVVLPPEEEIEWWKRRIKEIQGANPPEKLKLVEDELDNMRRRIRELSGLKDN